MEEIGKEAVKKAAKGVFGKVKSALGVGEAEIEVSDKGIKARAPSVEKAKELLDYGVETLLKLPQTKELLSKAGKRELEDPQVRSKKIKRNEDARKLLEAPKVKALPQKEKLQFSVFAFIAYGDESFHSDAFSEAEKAYQEAYEFAQKLADKSLQAICLDLIGAALWMQAEREKALVYVTKAVKLKPDFAEAWYNKGVALGELGKLEEALACYDKAIRLKPDDAEAWNNKGAALGELGKLEEAITCFDEAIKLKPDNAEVWYNKGVVLGELGKLEEALDCYDEAIKLKPDNAEVWYNKGVALGKLGQHKKALACYDEAIKLRPDYAEAWNNKGAILCDKLSKIDEAIVCFDQALELKPTLIEPWIGRGVALGKLARVEEAKTSLKKAFSLTGTMLGKSLMALDYLTQLILKQGLEGIVSKNMKEAEERALELVKLKNEAKKDRVDQVVNKSIREFKGGLSKRELKSFKGFEEILKRFKGKKP
jgi:Flp pilus assembly protein TadD